MSMDQYRIRNAGARDFYAATAAALVEEVFRK